MKTFDVPKWITTCLMEEGLSSSGYFLYGAGRALGFVRTAAHALDIDVPSSEFKVAEYHAYTGISAARTAIDATASWLNVHLQLNLSPSPRINLSRKNFRDKVLMVQPDIGEHVQTLGTLGTTIDEHRQRAQHREGLAIIYHLDSKKFGHTGGWYLAPNGLSSDRANDIRLPDLLHSWADEIECNLQKIHEIVATA